MDNIFAYLRSRWQLLLFYGIVLAILLLTAFLGNQDMGLALYAAAMLTFMLVLLLLAEGSRFAAGFGCSNGCSSGWAPCHPACPGRMGPWRLPTAP